MAAGCIVIGYDGHAGKEFMSEGRAEVIPFGDILSFVEVTRSVIKQWEMDPSRFTNQIEASRRFILENYSSKRERESIAHCWNAILQAAQNEKEAAASLEKEQGRLAKAVPVGVPGCSARSISQAG